MIKSAGFRAIEQWEFQGNHPKETDPAVKGFIGNIECLSKSLQGWTLF